MRPGTTTRQFIGRLGRWLFGLTIAVLLAACGYDAGVAKYIAPVINFTVTPTSIKQGQSVLATWTTTNATICSASGAWSGVVPTSNLVGASIGPIDRAGTYTYGVVCTGNGLSTTASQTVTVGAVPAPTVDLQISPGSVSPGAAATLTWSTSNATACSASGGTGSDGWANSVQTENLSGQSTGRIATVGNYIYNLTCTGVGGTTEQSVILDVSVAAPPAAPTATLTAQQSLVQVGQSGVLLWSSAYATTCAASGGSGSDAWSGAQPLSSSGTSTGPLLSPGTYSYTLSCTGPGGTVDSSASITVASASQPPAPTVNISVTPMQITAGSAAMLSWSSSNVDTCNASGSWSGTKGTTGANVSTGTLALATVYSYTLSCSGAGGSTSGTAVLTVNPPPASVVAFTALPPSVTVGQSTQVMWTSSNSTSCAGSGGTGGDGWGGNEPLSSSGTSIGPYATAGTFTYTLVCTGPGGIGTPKSASVTVTSPAPAAASITAFTAVPSTVQVGQGALLTWSSNAAAQCTAAGGTGQDGWNGSVGITGVGFSTGSFSGAGSITYTLVCSGPGGTSASSSVIVNVVSAPPASAVIVSFAAVPNVISVGQSIALNWSTSGATSCAASDGTGSDGWNGSVPTASTGTLLGPFNTAGTITYTLTCSGAGGASAPSSIIVNVNNAPPLAAQVTALAALPSTLQTGQYASLTWSTTNATSCTASGGTGADGWGGSVAVSSSGTTVGPLTNAGILTYVLNCSGPGGSGGPESVDVTVTAIPPGPATIVSFNAVPSSMQAGGSAILVWSTSGATACMASGGTGSDGWSGAQPASSTGVGTGIINTAGSYIYTLTCNGPGGTSAPSSTALNVTAVPPPAASIASFYATPNTIQAGQSMSLAWSSVSATSCIASGGSGSDSWNGTVGTSDVGMTIGPLNTVGSFVYVLTCSGPGGSSAPSSVTVNVNSAPPAPSIIAFTASPSALETGQSTTLSWATTDATACLGSGGTGSDGWIGALPASSAGNTVGPLGSTGTVTFTLTCTGAGGTSSPATANVTVSSVPPTATVSTFSASPSSIQTGQAVTLTWSSSNATFCTGSGGTGSDGWGGAALATSSNGTSTGSIATAGTYVYTLTCTGPGGTSAPSNAIVVVTVATPPASIGQFTATPASLLTGQSSQFAWSSMNASSCSGTGGTGSDGWSSTLATSSAATAIGPFNVAGNFTYSLACTGPGGTSAPASVIVAVANVPLAPSITAFAAFPNSLQTGQSTTLTWSSSNATSCTASGGSGSDGWSGTMGTSSSGTTEGPFASAATIVYTLVCSGPGGTTPPNSVTVNITAATPQPPTVSLLIAGGASAQIQPGQSTTLAWTSTNASSCSASGGTGSDGWVASRPTSGNGVSMGPINVPGSYSYTLTCSGIGGSASSTVTLKVIASGAADCGVGIPTTSLAGVGATATGMVNGGNFGLLCVGCSVNNPGNVVDGVPGDFATMVVPLAVVGNTELLVSTPATFPGGRQVGFILANGNTLLSLALLGGVTIETFAGGVLQESATVGNLLTLNAVHLITYNPDAGYASFTTTKPFDSVGIVVGSAVSLLTVMNVYQACVTLQ